MGSSSRSHPLLFSVVLGLVALAGQAACKGHATTTGTSSATSGATTGAGGGGGAADPWALLYDAETARVPSAMALLPNQIVVELASPTPGPMATLGTLPYAGGNPTDIATVGPYLTSDVFALATDDTSLYFAGTHASSEHLASLAVAGGTPTDLIPASAMKTFTLLGVEGGRVYFVDPQLGVESIATTGGATKPEVPMAVSVAALSATQLFYKPDGDTAVSARPLAGGAAVQVATEPSPILAMAASGSSVYWLEDAGDNKHSTVMSADLGGTGARALGTGEFHAIAADTSGVYAFFFDGDEKAVLERIDPKTGASTSIDSPFSNIFQIAVRPDVAEIVALGTVIVADAPGQLAYHGQVRSLPK